MKRQRKENMKKLLRLHHIQASPLIVYRCVFYLQNQPLCKLTMKKIKKRNSFIFIISSLASYCLRLCLLLPSTATSLLAVMRNRQRKKFHFISSATHIPPVKTKQPHLVRVPWVAAATAVTGVAVVRAGVTGARALTETLGGARRAVALSSASRGGGLERHKNDRYGGPPFLPASPFRENQKQLVHGKLQSTCRPPQARAGGGWR